jgi:phytoene dehydrogenase-like protein
MKIGVIGSGLGGLLAAVSLAKQRHTVTVFERLPYHGGRFTNIEHKGYQLSTGALHMIPHGANGPLGTMLKRLGVNVTIIRTSPPGLFRFDGKNYTHNQLQDLFGSWNKIKLVKLTADLRYSKGGSESYEEWVRKRISHKKVLDLANSFCRWSMSVDSDAVSSREVVAITRNVDRYGPPGVPLGGCRAVTDGLAEELTKSGGVIKSNIGPKGTVALCKESVFSSEYLQQVSPLKSANGIKISFSSEVPLVGSTCTLFTPEAERVGGLVELTHIDPSLAPKGKHLLMSHQNLYGDNIKKEIDAGVEDLRSIFPNFDRDAEILMVQSYKEHWPVNRVASGTHICPETEVKGLYNVGDGIKPVGFMETEGVAAGVELMLEKFNKDR